MQRIIGVKFKVSQQGIWKQEGRQAKAKTSEALLKVPIKTSH